MLEQRFTIHHALAYSCTLAHLDQGKDARVQCCYIRYIVSVPYLLNMSVEMVILLQGLHNPALALSLQMSEKTDKDSYHFGTDVDSSPSVVVIDKNRASMFFVFFCSQ